MDKEEYLSEVEKLNRRALDVFVCIEDENLRQAFENYHKSLVYLINRVRNESILDGR